MYVRFRQGVAMLYGRFADAQGGIWRIAGGVERNRVSSHISSRLIPEAAQASASTPTSRQHFWLVGKPLRPRSSPPRLAINVGARIINELLSFTCISARTQFSPKTLPFGSRVATRLNASSSARSQLAQDGRFVLGIPIWPDLGPVVTYRIGTCITSHVQKVPPFVADATDPPRPAVGTIQRYFYVT